MGSYPSTAHLKAMSQLQIRFSDVTSERNWAFLRDRVTGGRCLKSVQVYILFRPQEELLRVHTDQLMQQSYCKHPFASPKLQTPSAQECCFSTECRDSQLSLLSFTSSTFIYLFCVLLHFFPRLILSPCLKSSYPETLGPHVPSCSSIPVSLMWY